MAAHLLLAGPVVIGTMIGYFGECTSGRCPRTSTPFRAAIFGGLFGVLFSLSFANSTGCRHPTPPGQATSTDTPGKSETKAESAQEAVIHVNNEADFKKYVVEAKLPCLADFFSEACFPCQMLAPIIQTLGNKYKGKAVICKVSLDHAETHGLAQEYQIRGIPAVLFFENGKEIKRLVGLRPEEEYSGVLDSMMGKTGE